MRTLPALSPPREPSPSWCRPRWCRSSWPTSSARRWARCMQGRHGPVDPAGDHSIINAYVLVRSDASSRSYMPAAVAGGASLKGGWALISNKCLRASIPSSDPDHGGARHDGRPLVMERPGYPDRGRRHGRGRRAWCSPRRSTAGSTGTLVLKGGDGRRRCA